MDSHRSGDVPPPTTFLPLEAQEKSTPADGKTPSTHSATWQQPLSTTKKMFSARRLFLTFSVCLLVLVGLASASSSRTWQRIPCHGGEAPREATEPESGPLSLSSLLNAASPKALHEILQKHFPGRYQHGVWPSEREAVEAVHRVDEALATSLLQLAKRDGNSTAVPSSASSSFSGSSTSSPSESASTTPPASSTLPPVSSPASSSPIVSSTPSSSAKPPASTSTPPITSSTSKSPVSTSSEPSSTSESQSSTSGTSSKPAESSFSRSRPSSVLDVETTSIGPSSTSQSVSSLSDDGDTTLTTSTIGPSTTTMASTSTSRTLRLVIETFTSTNSNNGAVVTVVQTTYVDPEPAQTGTASTTKSPGSLQNAASKRGVAHGVVAGAVIGAALFI
ncbi:hypothetical protein B0T19DRAFT_156325 [Cercophora scortea]|uniref:Uncharacterized protein n=1 Tax=Cercophora scortea TaxID=314031 RepID=A0AAE0ILM0_9PEZI|nr:hypothetical protein B0T19DRAFT_156325 [Cercophora scortea]